MEELIKAHCGAQAYETAWAFDNLPHTKELYYDDEGTLVGLASYFPLERLDYDMIIMMHKDNHFSLSQWKWLKGAIYNRHREIRIQILGNKDRLEKLAIKHGGYFLDDCLIFPRPLKDFNKWQ